MYLTNDNIWAVDVENE